MVVGGYTKEVDGVMLDYMPSDIRDYDGTDFDLRVSFSDDPLDYAFYVTVPAEAERLTLRGLIDQHLLGVTREDRERISGLLDTEANPDLPQLYLAVRRAFDDQRRGKAVVRFHLNRGPLDVNLDDPVSRHFSRAFSESFGFDYRLVDLVIDVIDLPNLVLPPERQTELTREFRLIVLLYFMDRHSRDFAFEGRNLDISGIEQVADWAVTRNWLDLATKQVDGDYKGVYVRTEEGNKLLRGIVRETDNLIKQYDQYADVTLDEPPRFRTGRGDDLRIAVYRAEGIDPLRAAFLMNLENGLYDAAWQDIFRDDAFFRELLQIVGAPSDLPPQKLERIIRAGKAWAAQNLEETRRASRAAGLWDDAYRD